MKNKEIRSWAAIFSISSGIAGYSVLPLAALGSDDYAKPTQSDNSSVNQRERGTSALTADQAKNTRSDIKLMSDIRKALVQDKSLSAYAQNIKIIARHGKVTLKGPVHTRDEKEMIGAQAGRIAGTGNVKNMLTIKGS